MAKRLLAVLIASSLLLSGCSSMLAREYASVTAHNMAQTAEGDPSVLRADSYQELLCEDGIHPNEKGHQVILESLREAARQAVRQAAYQPPRLALA